MAVRRIVDKRVLWFCARCGRQGSKNIETTQTAEEHADETGHPVLATGVIVYHVGQGTISEEDPFAPKTRPRQYAYDTQAQIEEPEADEPPEGEE